MLIPPMQREKTSFQPLKYLGQSLKLRLKVIGSNLQYGARNLQVTGSAANFAYF